MAGPLEGLKVVDCTEGIAGPYCAMQLGDAGADVIKVESVAGDATRGWGPPFVDGQGAAFLALNRNKRSLALDRGSEAGKHVLQRLLQQADVLIEDWGPGAADQLGMGYDVLRQGNPRLVHCAITPFGEEGPFRERPGAEVVLQAMSEVTESLGEIGRPPVRLGADIAGMYAGISATQGILAALFRRNRVGEGQRVAISLLGSLMFMRGVLWAAHSDPEEWIGSHLDSYIMPANYGYQAKDGAIYLSFILGLTPEQWSNFLDEIGLSHVKQDARFATARDTWGSGRYGYLVQEIWNTALREKTVAEIEQIMAGYGGQVSRLHNYEMLFAHPQLPALGLMTEVPHPEGGNFKAVGMPWSLAETPTSVRRPPPALGQHTEEVLESVGATPADVAGWRATGAVK